MGGSIDRYVGGGGGGILVDGVGPSREDKTDGEGYGGGAGRSAEGNNGIIILDFIPHIR